MAEKKIYRVGDIFSIRGKSYKVVMKRGVGCYECPYLKSNVCSVPCIYCVCHVYPGCFLEPYNE